MSDVSEIIQKYTSYFENRGHVKIPNASLIPQNDPTTLFINSGMQPLVPYLLGEVHPRGKRLFNVQNCFRAQDIEEIGDNRHTTFFRMLGNWSLGDYFKEEQLSWFFQFLIDKKEGLGLDPQKLYITLFEGDKNSKVLVNGKSQSLRPDTEANIIWTDLLESIKLNPKEKIHFYGIEKNWWSRSGTPQTMPIGEPGGPSSEVFYDFGESQHFHERSNQKDKKCHINCDCGRYVEIGNSVFMQYRKIDKNLVEELPNKNVDFGGGLERLLAAVENQSDIFKTSLFAPILSTITTITGKSYEQHAQEIRIIIDHFTAAIFITANNIVPSNKEQGYILRRLIRRGLDNFYTLEGKDIIPVIETVLEQYKDTDPYLVEKYVTIKNTLVQEEQMYQHTLHNARKYIEKKYSGKNVGGEILGQVEISADDAFTLYATHGLSPTQIQNLGYVFHQESFAQKMEEHQNVSRKGAAQKFTGGLADHQEKTIMGHTATHLLHQALRDVLGDHVHQTGSNITTERLRFDFNYDEKLNDEQIKQLTNIVNEKIKENLQVHYEIIPTDEARKRGAIGLFEDIYSETSKIYFIGSNPPYSIEFCGGPHVEFTGMLKKFTMIKQENIGQGQRRIYARIG